MLQLLLFSLRKTVFLNIQWTRSRHHQFQRNHRDGYQIKHPPHRGKWERQMETLASFFKALADPTRLRILYCLRHGELCVCDIMAALDMPQSTISRHLTTLKHAKLVQGRRCGKWMYYKQDTPDNMLAEAVRRLLVSPNTELALSAVVQGDTARLRHHLETKPANACD